MTATIWASQQNPTNTALVEYEGVWRLERNSVRHATLQGGEMKWRGLENKGPRGAATLLCGQDSDSQQPIENVDYCSQTKAEFITLNI